FDVRETDARTPLARFAAAVVIAPAFVISSRARPVWSMLPGAISTSLPRTVPPVKSTTTRTKPRWLAIRIFVAVTAADAEAGSASSSRARRAVVKMRWRRLLAWWHPAPAAGRARRSSRRLPEPLGVGVEPAGDEGLA